MSDQWTDRLSEYLDDELPAAERAAMERHLAVCTGCSVTLDELRAVVRAAAGLGDTAPERDLWAGIARRIEAEPAQPPVIPIEQARARRRFSFTLPQLAAASVALVAASSALMWALLSGRPQPATLAAAPTGAATAPAGATTTANPALSASTDRAPAGSTAPAIAAPSGVASGPTQVAVAAPERSTERASGARPAAEPAGGRALVGPRRPAPAAGAVLVSAREQRQYDHAVRDLETLLSRERSKLRPETVAALEQSLATIDQAIADARAALRKDPANEYLGSYLADSMRRKVELLRQATSLIAQS